MMSSVEKPDGTSTDWIVQVETESVMIYFNSLTRTKHLTVNLVNHLNSALLCFIFSLHKTNIEL